MPALVLLSGCRASRRPGCRRPSATLALVLASLVSIPFLFLKRREKKARAKKKATDPSLENSSGRGCFALPLLFSLSSVIPPELRPRLCFPLPSSVHRRTRLVQTSFRSHLVQTSFRAAGLSPFPSPPNFCFGSFFLLSSGRFPQGPWSAPELRPRLSSLFRPSEDAPRPDEEPDRATKRDPNGIGFRA